MHGQTRVLAAANYIEANLFDKLTHDSIAQAAHLSTYHFSRLFKSLTGVSVMAYVTRRRLAIAAQRLANERTSVLAIAIDCGFESHEVFSRAFKRYFKVTPSAFRAGNTPVWPGQSPALNAAMLRHFDEHLTLQPRYIEIDGFSVTGLADTYTQQNKDDIPGLWERLLVLLPDELANEQQGYYGVSVVNQLSEFDYIAGLTGIDLPAPAPLTSLELPAGVYATFSHRGPLNTIANTVAYIWGVWQQSTRDEVLESPDFEYYPKLLAQPEKLDIYIPVVPA